MPTALYAAAEHHCLPVTAQYANLSSENWSETAWAHPACIIQPINEIHLQRAVSLLVESNVPFAIRSGGHLPSPLGANIDTGVLIDMSSFSQIHYSANKSVVTMWSWAEVWDWHATSFMPNSAFSDKLSTMMTNASEVSTISSLNTGTLVLGLQPISTSLIEAGQARGSNSSNTLGLTPRNQTWLVLDVGWHFQSDDNAAHAAGGALNDRIERASVKSGNYVDYVFVNDASWDQDVIKHYGPCNVARLKRVREAYDPSAVFQRLVPGGFKLDVEN
ncbi:unnamed protein product [Penicillium egyptiacum]|uniref:FAD linked oxidase N-terminal domain-containing protein n=1 Tax=Penicillium egyptiacum TaxID=1303716 RepID=A0A9W4KF23_9EURO|nr:unnamed protein product [Penicillium egyptiacum]